MDAFRIGFPLYDQVDLIDVTVPYDIFSRVTAIGGRAVELLLIGPTMAPVTSGQRFRIAPDVDFGPDVLRPIDLDVDLLDSLDELRAVPEDVR